MLMEEDVCYDQSLDKSLLTFTVLKMSKETNLPGGLEGFRSINI